MPYEAFRKVLGGDTNGVKTPYDHQCTLDGIHMGTSFSRHLVDR